MITLSAHLEGFVCNLGKKSAFLVAATSSSPNAAPWALPVPWSLGAGQPMMVFRQIKLGSISDGPSSLEGVSKCGDILAVVMSVTVSPVHRLHMPAVRGVASRGVLGESDVSVVLDRDPVAVIDQGEIAEPLRGRKRRSLGRDALLDVPIRGETVDAMVEDRGAWRRIWIEQSPLRVGGHRHSHSIPDALAERPNRDLDTLRMRLLRVSRSHGSPESAGLDVVEFEPETAEIELNVERQAGVSTRQRESVPPWPRVSRGLCRITFWNSRYATGARLIAVPGWPLTFCTASAASTRMVSTASESSRSTPLGEPCRRCLVSVTLTRQKILPRRLGGCWWGSPDNASLSGASVGDIGSAENWNLAVSDARSPQVSVNSSAGP